MCDLNIMNVLMIVGVKVIRHYQETATSRRKNKRTYYRNK